MSSSASSITKREKVEVLPLNPPGNNTYSFKRGNPIVNFQIASQDKLLLGSTLRLNGTIQVQTSAGVLVNNNDNKGGGATEVRINERVGVHSCLNQITFSNANNQTIEQVRQYGRYLATVLPLTHSAPDFNTNLQMKSLNSNKNILTGNLINNNAQFSMPIMTGFLNAGMPIPLGLNGVNGINIQFELAPDNFVLSGGNASDGTGAEYLLKDLSITYDLLVPDAKGVAAMASGGSGMMAYNSIQHLYSVINSSENTQSFNIGTANTLGIFHNFIPTTEINNYASDSLSTNPLQNSAGGGAFSAAQLQEVDFIKAGVKYPLNYTIDNRTGAENNTPSTQVERNLINSVKPFNKSNHILMGNTTNLSKPDAIFFKLNQDVGGHRQTDQDSAFGVGIAFDNLSKQGVNYKNSNYAVRLKSTLDGLSPNAMYSYVISKNTLMWSPQGLQVVS